jgi:Holliday junction resolvase RusA-like endonuclease
VTFACTIPGDPRGKGSVRVYNGRAMKDPKTADYMARASLAMHEAHGGRPPIHEPTSVRIVAYLARPMALVPKERSRVPQPPAGAFAAPAKPDLDNLAKCLLDSLTQAGVIVDDCRVVELHMTKLYVAVGEAPRVDVRVEVAPAYGASPVGWWAR